MLRENPEKITVLHEAKVRRNLIESEGWGGIYNKSFGSGLEKGWGEKSGKALSEAFVVGGYSLLQGRRSDKGRNLGTAEAGKRGTHSYNIKSNHGKV